MKSQGFRPRAGPASGERGAVRPGPRRAAPNPLWSRLATTGPRPTGILQRSQLSDSVKEAYNKAQTAKFEALLARLGQDDVRQAQGDTDIDAEIASLLANRPDDLWVAQRIRQGKLGDTTGKYAPPKKPGPKPIEAFFFQGTSDQRALVIAGVHGTEKQGTQVAKMLIDGLKTSPPYMTTIVVPSLFPDNADAGTREAGKDKDPDKVLTNGNFPEPGEDLAAARAAGNGTAVAAGNSRKTPILPENVLLLELLERFKPARIISIHGTWRAGAGGVFYDKRNLTGAEVRQARQEAADMVDDFFSSHGGFGNPDLFDRQDLKNQFFGSALASLSQQTEKADEDLSRRAANQIDTDTQAKGVKERELRHFIREDDPRDKADPKKVAVSKADRDARAAHPSVAGNVGKSGNVDRFTWSGKGTSAVSLGEYAAPRGMSVFTVEPPINATTDDYLQKGFTLDKVSEADRRIELQSYADAVRTVLLGK